MLRTFSRWASVLCLLPFAVHAAAGSLLFGVSEGTSSSLDSIFMQTKYAPLAAYLAAASGNKVALETPKVLSVVARNLERKRYDVLLLRPGSLSARAMRDHGYRLLAVANGEAKLHFIVRGDSALKQLRDIKGHSIAMPDPIAYPSNLGLALLRDQGIAAKRSNIQYLDRQDAVGLVVQSGLADVGVVMSYSKVGEEWLKKGGRFLHSQGNFPFWSVLVSPDVTPQQAERMQRALLALQQSPRSRRMLDEIGISGFNAGNPLAYLDMLQWIEGKTPTRISQVM